MRMEKRTPKAPEKPGASSSLSPTELLRLSGKKALDKILDSPMPARLVQSLAEEDLFWLVQDIGPEDALPILSLASNEQWQYLLDLEVWDKDRLEIDSVNQWLGLLLKADPERFLIWGLRENTVVLFCTDHGELLGDHGLILKGPLHYESLLRVPFLWNGPNHLAGGRTVGGLASLIDLFPSILDLAGVPIPAGTQGKTLIRPLRGETDRAHDQVTVENDADVLGLRLRTLVTERWKVTWTANQRAADQVYGEIYDLEEDPHELNSVYGDSRYVEVEADLKAELKRLRSYYGDSTGDEFN